VARAIPENRFADLVRVATQVFIERGYRLTQMADVAEALGVAKGTLYGYVESKEALFQLCLEHASGEEPIETPPVLPLPTPPRGALIQMLRASVGKRAPRRVLREALDRERAPDIRVELESILRELYDLTETYAVAIRLLESAASHMELSREWQTRGRQEARDLLERYLRSRIDAGQLRPAPDLRLAARFVIEVIATWAMHIKWDRFPQKFDPKAARDHVVEFLVRGLISD
jgi:AcrR family transcriptional regulator